MKIVCLFSGGLDSATLLYHLREQRHEVLPFWVNYGQRHHREWSAAVALARAVELPLWTADVTQLQTLFGAGNSLTGRQEQPDLAGSAVVVPARNLVLISLAAAYAIAQDAGAVAYAAHVGDRQTFPDCRPEFTDAISAVLALCHYEPVRLLTPFAGLLKSDIVLTANRLGVPFGLTYSCYAGGERHCGRCGACRERRSAFRLAGVVDPTEYEECAHARLHTAKEQP